MTDANGLFEDGYDIAPLLDLEGRENEEKEMVGFSVDGEGNILFTIPVLFKAFKLTPDRKLTAFGEKGSLPGRFNVVGGIAADDRGYYLIVDTLRSVVMVFDKDFRFLTEFGHRGYRPGNLVAPRNLVVDNSGKVFVTQGGRRGVSVYRVSSN